MLVMFKNGIYKIDPEIRFQIVGFTPAVARMGDQYGNFTLI